MAWGQLTKSAKQTYSISVMGAFQPPCGCRTTKEAMLALEYESQFTVGLTADIMLGFRSSEVRGDSVTAIEPLQVCHVLGVAQICRSSA